MTLNKSALYENAAANTAFNNNKRIKSLYDVNCTFANITAAPELGVCYPVGFNKTVSKFAPWMAPDPTVLVITLTGATGGTFTVTVNGATTASLAYNASAATVAAAIKAIGYTATVAKASAVYTITFNDDPELEVLPTVSATITNASGDVSESATPTAGTQIVEQDLLPTELLINVGDADGGTFTITHGAQTTGDIAYNATPAAVSAALAALATPVIASCQKVGATEIKVAFDSLTDLVTLPTVSATLTGLTTGGGATSGEVATAVAGTALVPDPTTLAVDVGTATGGTFTITVNGETTAALAFDATANQVTAALLAIGYTVTTALVGTVYTVTFGALPELLNLPTVTGDISGLSGAGLTAVATAGTASGGTHKVFGFVNPNPIQTHATNDVLGMVMVSGEIHYAEISALVDSGDVSALQTALKDGLVSKSIVVQGLAGIH